MLHTTVEPVGMVTVVAVEVVVVVVAVVEPAAHPVICPIVASLVCLQAFFVPQVLLIDQCAKYLPLVGTVKMSGVVPLATIVPLAVDAVSVMKSVLTLDEML